MQYKALDKFSELQRAYNKLKKISTDNGNTISLSDPYDEVDNFFFHSYSLKDWIKNDSTLNKNKRLGVEDYINSHKELALAIDYY